MAHLLTNNRTKNYGNKTATVKIIVEGWYGVLLCNTVDFGHCKINVI